MTATRERRRACSGDALAHVRAVHVGSTNGPKVEAVRRALAPYAPEARVEAVAVASGVPEQPVGWEEIVRGARNRAAAARAAGACELGVGIEDGLVRLGPGLPVLNVGCAAVSDGEQEGLGFSAGFEYPPACWEPALGERLPIGPLFDRLWKERRGEAGSVASGLTVGNVGKLTLGALPRAEYARHAVACALVRLLHPDLYASAGDAA